jgi:anaerobic magnesium-protoporphyrin IX monomethyl ester cyclase
MNIVTLGVSEAAKADTGRRESARIEKVVVVNPPSPPGYVANRDSQGGHGQLYPIGATIPIALDIPYLLAYLAERSISIEALEAQGLEIDGETLAKRVAEIAEEFAPKRILVVVRVALCCLDWDLSICAAIKQAAPAIELAIYGPIVPEILKRLEQETSVDYLLQGEPDATVVELAAGLPRESVAGLHFRRDGVWVHNPSRPLAKDLDALPFPKWDALPYQRYTLPRSSTTSADTFLPMLTSRGCPFGCHYCPYPVNQGLPFRFRSPQNVVDEIEHLVKDLGIQYILFRDPMFSLRQDRVIAICDEIRRRKLAVRWKCETRIDCLNEPTLRAMADAGCEGINFGIESSEVEIQSSSGRKPITQKQIIETVELCRRLKIKTFCFFIIGLPGDTVQTILETIDFAIRLRPNWVQFNAASPLIGTKLRAWAVSKGLVTEDEYAYRNCHEATIGNENLTKEQVASLYKFSVFFERYLMNRGGILKDATRTGVWYRTARICADRVASMSARAIFAIGRNRFERASTVAAPPQGQGAT